MKEFKAHIERNIGIVTRGTVVVSAILMLTNLIQA